MESASSIPPGNSANGRKVVAGPLAIVTLALLAIAALAVAGWSVTRLQSVEARLATLEAEPETPPPPPEPEPEEEPEPDSEPEYEEESETSEPDPDDDDDLVPAARQGERYSRRQRNTIERYSPKPNERGLAGGDNVTDLIYRTIALRNVDMLSAACVARLGHGCGNHPAANQADNLVRVIEVAA